MFYSIRCMMSKITRQLQADRIIVRQPCDKAVIDLQCACIHYGFCFCIKVHHMNHMDIQVILHSALCCFEGFCRDTLLHVIYMYSYNNHRNQIAANVNHQCLHSGIASWWFRVTTYNLLYFFIIRMWYHQAFLDIALNEWKPTQVHYKSMNFIWSNASMW